MVAVLTPLPYPPSLILTSVSVSLGSISDSIVPQKTLNTAVILNAYPEFKFSSVWGRYF